MDIEKHVSRIHSPIVQNRATMRYLFLLLFNLCSAVLLFGQQQPPVNWQYSAKKVSDKTWEVHVTALIRPGWHVYAQHQPKDAIAAPTVIKFTSNPLLKLLGPVKEIGDRQKRTIAELNVTQYQYEQKVDFVQVVKTEHDVTTNLTFQLTFQACTDEQCLPPDTRQFTIRLG